MRLDVEEQEDVEHEGLKMRLLQKCLLSINMKSAFSFLRTRRRRAAVKESFLGFWSFGEFFLSPFFSSSFHFPRFTGKKGNNTD